MSRYALLHGDVLDVLRTLPDNSAHGLLCDPPYGISFMGRAWDYDVPPVEVWREALRVLRPGAPLLAFGGSRTFHRIAVRIEDAGFELRDTLVWLYGSGFPKSLAVDKAIDKAAGATREVTGTRTLTGSAALTTAEKGGTFAAGTSSAGRSVEVAITAPATELARQWGGYGTALKPAFEPVILARKPLDGTVAANVARWGVGGLAIDACRVATDWSERSEAWKQSGHSAKPDAEKIAAPPGRGISLHDAGRFPANVLLDEYAAAALDAQTPHSQSGTQTRPVGTGGIWHPSDGTPCGPQYGDSGGPSRFFYTAKAPRSERERGCASLPLRSAGEVTDREDDTAGLSSPRAGAGRTGGARNHHPTVKPLALIQYLARLIRPPVGGVLLVPYAGSGSEVAGSLLAGWPAVVGIEREAEYLEIAGLRVPAHCPGAKRIA